MQVKILLALVVTALVAGLPAPKAEPEPEAEPENIDVVVGPDGFDSEVDVGDRKLDGYVQMVKTPGKTSFLLETKIFDEANGDNCCKVKVPFSYNPVMYLKYENGSTDVPCGGRLAGKNGTCINGNVVCDIDNMGNGNIDITFNVDCDSDYCVNRSININLESGSSLYDVMLMALQENNEFRFTEQLYQGGVFIDSIGGVYNNVTTDWFWILYNCTVTPCTWAEKGVSTTYPKNGDIWTFLYQLCVYDPITGHCI